jgi:hypothetical protein
MLRIICAEWMLARSRIELLRLKLILIPLKPEDGLNGAPG